MSVNNYLSEIDDCWEMFDYLSSEYELQVDTLNQDSMLIFHYQNSSYALRYNKEHFLRLNLIEYDDQNNALTFFYQIASSIIGGVGKWPIYYDMVTSDKRFPTLEWCLEMSKSANELFLLDIVNSELFDDGTICENVRTFPKQKLKVFTNNFR